jgi:hypothetical protein
VVTIPELATAHPQLCPADHTAEHTGKKICVFSERVLRVKENLSGKSNGADAATNVRGERRGWSAPTDVGKLTTQLNGSSPFRSTDWFWPLCHSVLYLAVSSDLSWPSGGP